MTGPHHQGISKSMVPGEGKNGAPPPGDPGISKSMVPGEGKNPSPLLPPAQQHAGLQVLLLVDPWLVGDWDTGPPWERGDCTDLGQASLQYGGGGGGGGGGGYDYMALEFVFLSEARANKGVTANLSCQLVDPINFSRTSSDKIGPYKSFQHPSDSSGKFSIMARAEAHSSGYLRNGSVVVECTITVFRVRHLEDNPVPSSNLQKDLGELLRSGCGADVTFIVSGESIDAHKNVLAVRSPVFMAEFFGQMKETTSKCIEIKEMEAAVFKAMLQFIYTDMVPDLDEKKDTVSVTTMAQHLLVAADRYGLDLLKEICLRRIALGIDAAMVATTLTLAEQHGCSQLKAKCIEFIAGASPEVLGSVLATEGFKSLEPSLLTELFMAAQGRIRK
ncbi:hypothetical protein EJB05_54241, partial [Eragrostis curvula]